jgi:hypothetical protein
MADTIVTASHTRETSAAPSTKRRPTTSLFSPIDSNDSGHCSLLYTLGWQAQHARFDSVSSGAGHSYIRPTNFLLLPLFTPSSTHLTSLHMVKLLPLLWLALPALASIIPITQRSSTHEESHSCRPFVKAGLPQHSGSGTGTKVEASASCTNCESSLKFAGEAAKKYQVGTQM